jgi:hypothetical protein
MTDLERWLDANDRFLAAALAWLRHRLESLASAPSASLSAASAQSSWAQSTWGQPSSTVSASSSPAQTHSAWALPVTDAVTRPADAPIVGHARSRSLLARIWGSGEEEEPRGVHSPASLPGVPATPEVSTAAAARTLDTGGGASGATAGGHVDLARDDGAGAGRGGRVASFADARGAAARGVEPAGVSEGSRAGAERVSTSTASGPVSGGSPLLAIDPASSDPPPALALLARRLGLTEFESHILLLCAAMELDTRTGSLCARAMQDAARPFPTFALALTLFDRPAWDAMSPERPLRYWRLIEINQPGAQPLVTSALKADERIVNYLKGLNYLDDRLAPLVTPVAREAAPLPVSQQQTSDALAEYLARARETAHPPVLQLLGADGQSKLLVAERAAARLGLLLHRIGADTLPAHGPDLETFARLWQREGALLPLALYIDAADVDRTSGPAAGAVQRLCKRGMGAVFLDTRQQWPDLGRGALAFDVAKPTPAEQHAAWTDALGAAARDTASRLAGQFNFNLPSIQAIAAGAHARAAAAAAADAAQATAPAHLVDSARFAEIVWSDSLRHARPALDQLAQPLDAKARWEDLELPAAEKGLLHQVAQQVAARLAVYDAWGFRDRMNRGLGISVLFAGESGTGKTMAAEVLANDLSLMLYRIDLSSVVSKYIGETERNLRKLFDAAEDGGAMLFFDEADALFGKRSEVKDSHDRYANIEINYLLQRMETYRGLAILATNMKSALDGAFCRRLRFIINFPFPGPTERLAIWRKAFPARAPLSGLDYARLARFNVTGGSIHNIALNAAFLAAHAGEPISMRLVMEAARNEYRKLEKPINEAEFRWLDPPPASIPRVSGVSGDVAQSAAAPAAPASASGPASTAARSAAMEARA